MLHRSEPLRVTSFRFPPDMRAAIAKLADERRESVSAIVRAALASYIEAPSSMRDAHTGESSVQHGNCDGLLFLKEKF